ncbi:alpha/beta fold hydrolase [Micromonospora sp. NPDC007271]|uniref:alpha/beta fold hydrolase n=1 Tax=Micromonospora sp. NPDC007271 TaxID=3154587 RepID=UPI00340C47FD
MQSFPIPGSRARMRFHDLPGDDPVHVYLPGLACASSADFPETTRHPGAAGFRAILVDLLGAGFSDRPEWFSYSLEDHAETVAALLDGLGVRDCVLVGHSMGGSIAVLLAGSRPDLVAQLILAEPNLGPVRGMLSPYIVDLDEDEFVRTGHAALLGKLDEVAEQDVAAANFAALVRVCSPLALHRSSRSLARVREPGLRARLDGLPMPRAVLIGELSGYRHGGFAAHGIMTVTVAGAGHAMNEEQPAAFAAAIGVARRTTTLVERGR